MVQMSLVGAVVEQAKRVNTSLEDYLGVPYGVVEQYLTEGEQYKVR